MYERTPQRGASTNVILTLLDICRAAQAPNPLTLKPPHEQAKKLSICNGSSCVDKETNTSQNNLLWQQLYDDHGRSMISDKCDNDNHLDVKDKPNHKSKCCVANNTTSTINCSTNSINFDNLQLQCMCSSDNNSLDDYQTDTCDNCSATNPQTSPCKHHHVDPPAQSVSFRERLLDLAGSSSRHDNNLRKRNSELVLGTNFDGGTVGIYRGSQSYQISCDNIFSNKPPATTTAMTTTSISNSNNINKSNHSLSTESDRISQIPYSFLERPTMKLSQSEDRNLRELKIALSSTLPSANKTSNSVVVAAKSNTKIATHQPQSCTSSSSTSSKVDRISFTLSTSSTSDVLKKSSLQPSEEARLVTDEANKQPDAEGVNAPSEDNKMITATARDKSTHVNNNNGNSGSDKKRKTPEGKLAIDLNDRSKYGEEVSV